MRLSLDGGPGPEWVCPGPTGSVWILAFMLERFHNTSPRDFEGMFITPGDSKIREGLAQKSNRTA